MFSVQAKVTLHSDDGLSVVLSRSLLVAASNVMRKVLSDTCHVDTHVSLAGVNGVTLSTFVEIFNCSQDSQTKLRGKMAEDVNDLLNQLDCIFLSNRNDSKRTQAVKQSPSVMKVDESGNLLSDGNNNNDQDSLKKRQIWKSVKSQDSRKPSCKSSKRKSKLTLVSKVDSQSSLKLKVPPIKLIKKDELKKKEDGYKDVKESKTSLKDSIVAIPVAIPGTSETPMVVIKMDLEDHENKASNVKDTKNDDDFAIVKSPVNVINTSTVEEETDPLETTINADNNLVLNRKRKRTLIGKMYDESSNDNTIVEEVLKSKEFKSKKEKKNKIDFDEKSKSLIKFKKKITKILSSNKSNEVDDDANLGKTQEPDSLVSAMYSAPDPEDSSPKQPILEKKRKSSRIEKKKKIMKNSMLSTSSNQKVDTMERVDIDNDVEVLTFDCPLCSETFLKQSVLLIHVKTAHPDESYVCSICNRYFKSKKTLSRHYNLDHSQSDQKVANASPSLQCNICSKRYSCHANLSRHKKIHLQTETLSPERIEVSNASHFCCSICFKILGKSLRIN